MGLFNTIRMGSSAAGDYEVEQSLRFDDDQSSPSRLQRTIQSGGNKNKWTLSVWVKRSQLGNPDYSNSLGGNDGQQILHAAGAGNRGLIKFKTDDTLSFEQGTDGGYSAGRITTTAVFRDTSAWYHLCFVADYANSTTADRAKIFVNGVQQEVTTNVTFLDGSASDDCIINRDRIHEIGFAEYAQGYTGSSNWFNFFCGYMAEFYFIDGQAYDPTYFTKTNPVTGQLVPKEYTGGFGTTGWYLDFLDNSAVTATTLGKDSSGNGNNWTPNGFAVSDAMKDSPTNNFATMTPLNGYTGLSQGNLRFNTYNDSSGPRSVQATIALPKSGKWYWEARYQESGTGTVSTKYFGLSQIQNTNGYLTAPYVYYGRTNIKNGTSSEDITNAQDWYNGTGVPAIVAIAVDVDNNSVEYFHNGSSQGTITLPTLTSLQEYFFTWANTSGGSSSSLNDTFNFGADSTFQGQVSSGGNTDANGIGDFKYAPPAGHLALCSANLPDPTILLPNKHFDTLLYTGNGSTNNITGLNFSPDWVWGKTRNTSAVHYLFDQVRGVNKYLDTQTDAETTSQTDLLTAFNSDGFTLGANAGSKQVNKNGNTYVAWNWNAGGSTVTNNDGSISSQVRANTTAGFSIVTYTGTGSDITIGHGLGVAPDVIIVKCRNNSTQWGVYHSSIAPNYILQLSVNNAQWGSSNVFNNESATSSVFSVDGGSGMSGTAHNFVAYCFSEVAGYSKFGSYTGNGNADGTFVFTGFRPAFLIIKRTDSAKNWFIHDNKREGYNPQNDYVSANTSDAETNVTDLDLLSNGFKLKSTGLGHNASGGTYIYLCFAESPFKYSRAR